jgi:excisionase family DNA binding protein
MIPPATQKLIKHVLKPLYDYGMISSDAWKELMEKIADDSVKPKRPILLLTPEVAEILKLSTKTVHRLADEGELPYYKITGKRALRFKLEDVERLIDEGRIVMDKTTKSLSSVRD